MKKRRKLLMQKRILSLLIFLLTLYSPAIYSTEWDISAEDIFQQSGYITGIVLDESGEPVIGANVVIEGTTNGTTTDLNGNFSITRPDRDKRLLISFIGYKSTSVTINNSEHYRIVLQEDTELLDEVIVIGYGTKTKREVTGAIAKVSASELSGNSGRSNVITALQGRAPGVQITTADGSPDGAIRIRVRGNSSLNSGGEPLLVLDGMPIGSDALAAINTEDIESIEILKDAAAAAIYGSRASNGVVLLTSKQGKKGKTTVNANYEYGSLTPIKEIDMLSGDGYVETMDRAIRNREQIGGLGSSSAYSIFPTAINGAQGFTEEWVRNNHPNTNWRDQIYGNGHYHKANISISGGEERTTFFLSGSYRGDKGMLKGDDRDRITGRLNVEHTANKWLKAGANVSIINTVRNNNTGSFSGAHTSLLPIYPIHRPNNPAYYFGDYIDNTTGNINPIFRREESSNKNNSYHSMNTLYLQLTPLEGLTLRHEFGVNYNFSHNRQYKSMYLFPKDAPDNRAGGNGFVSNGRYQGLGLTNTTTANYTKQFLEYHKIGVLAGMAFEDSKSSGNTNQKEGFQTEAQKIDGAQYIAGGESENQTRFVSYFGRISYSLMEKYMLEASFRRDGSNRFGPGNRWGNFKGFSVGWVLSDESFMESAEDILNFLKLRLSYGQTGNAEIGSYKYLSKAYVSWNSAKYADYAGILGQQIGDKNLGWEVTTQFNVGLDYGFLDNRINGSIEYYYKKSTDLLMDVPGSHSYGWEQTSLLANIGEISSKGFEFNVNATIINNRNFKWISEFNIATGKTMVDKLVRDKGENYPGYFTVNTTGYSNGGIVMEGQPLGTYFLPIFAGFDPVTGHELIYARDQGRFETTGETVLTGNVIDATRYNSLTGQNAVISDKTSQPKVYGGWNNRFSYKDIDLSFIFYYQAGNYIFDASEMKMSYAKAEGGQMLSSVQDLPLIYGQPTVESTRFLHNASFIRLKNLQLGYSFPRKLLNKTFLNELRLFATGENLFTLTKYKGNDPEFFRGSGITSNVMPGVYDFQLPQPRIFSFGVSISL